VRITGAQVYDLRGEVIDSGNSDCGMRIAE
jgi:hypothetical protein